MRFKLGWVSFRVFKVVEDLWTNYGLPEDGKVVEERVEIFGRDVD